MQYHAGQRQLNLPGVQPFKNTDIDLLLDVHVFVVISGINDMDDFERQAVAVKSQKMGTIEFCLADIGNDLPDHIPT